MSTMITPTYLQNFETELRFVMTNAWTRTLANLWFPRLMNTTTVGGARQYIEWMLESARIQPTGPKGASMSYDPLIAISHTLRHDHFGNGLELFRSDIEDDNIARAPKWADDTGGAQAYWPQRGLVQAMQNGKLTQLNGRNNTAYDGKAFFAVDHPINPYDDSQDDYSNLHIGTPFTAENLARVVAYMRKIRHAGAAPMGPAPILPVFPANFQYRAGQIFDAEVFTDVLSSSVATASNTFKTSYQFQPAIIADELSNEPTVWYLGVPANQDAFDTPFIYVEREPYSVNTYSPIDQAALSRMQVFRWENRGRNGFAYGHPYMFHRIEAGGSQPSYLSDLDL